MGKQIISTKLVKYYLIRAGENLKYPSQETTKDIFEL